jgi:hypothetical protein
VVGRRLVGLVGVEIVQVEKERLREMVEQALGARVDAIGRALTAGFVEGPEAASVASLEVDVRRRRADDDARRDRSRGVAASSEDLGQRRGVFGMPIP